MATNAKAKRQRRAPLIESDTEEALRKRGVELVGFFAMLLAAASFTLLWTYFPDDPSLFSATDAPPRNALGLIGAYVADPVHRAIGWAAFGIPAALAIWGLRLITHSGENRCASRAILVPLALVAAAAFASAHVPLAGWAHEYGLGGLLGDAVLKNFLSLLPAEPASVLKFGTLALGIVFVFSAALALGVTLPEARAFAGWAKRGAVAVYAALFSVTRRGVMGATHGVRTGAARAADRRKASPRTEASRTEPSVRASVTIPRFDPQAMKSQEDTVSAKIAAAVKARANASATPTATADDSATGLIAPSRRLPDAPPPSTTEDSDDVLFEPRVHKHGVKQIQKSTRARSEEQPELALDPTGQEEFELPALSLLENPSTIVRHMLSDDALEENARMLENVLDDYGVRGDIVSIRPGPVVTMYELEPAAGLKASRVIGLSDDIARSMSALACRVSTIPGRSVIGIELPNEQREKVLLREILSAKSYGDSSHALPLALGKDIGGEPIVANLARMPHLLIAGTTGSGKSVAINTMILSLLYKLTPEECRVIMIDPKMLELSVYDGIPHLLSPVVTDPKKAVVALKWVVAEMEERYRKMSKMGVRNIDGYNSRVRDALTRGEAFTRTVQTGFDDDTGEPVFETEEFQPETMPYIVVIVDEMADLMMVAGKEIEACIQRLAQMARASGIHLIMATQRPSVDVITGTIKANFPTRISFQVTSKIDSRTILGEMGAEQLLGMGDMLYMAGGGRITRVHGPFVSDEEVEDVVRHLKSLGPPEYHSGVVEGPEGDAESEIDLVLGLGGNTTSEDALYDQAVAIVAKDRKCSTSYIQRKLAIGYNKAARLVEQMEDDGVVSQANHVGKREVLIPER